MNIFTVLGICFVLMKGFAVCRWFWIHFVCRNDLSCYGARQGGWALVTGASAGIGEAFAWELARRGMNVVIVARSTQILEDLAENIRRECKVQVLVVTADATRGERAVQDILNQLRSGNDPLKLTLLINNVGVEFGDPCPLLLKETKHIDGMIDVNVRFSTLMTRGCLPLLLTSTEKNGSRDCRAGIINVASTAANATLPLLAVYSGTKAYNQAFSTALSSEMRQHHITANVDVLSVRASFVETKMSGLKANCLHGYMMQVILPSSFVKSSLDKLSFVDDISPHWAHDLQTIFITSIPRFLAEKFLYYRVYSRYEANLIQYGTKKLQ